MHDLRREADTDAYRSIWDYGLIAAVDVSMPQRRSGPETLMGYTPLAQRL